MDSSEYSSAISSYEQQTSSFDSLDSSEMQTLQSVNSTVPSLISAIDSLATPVSGGAQMPDPRQTVGPFHRMEFFDWWGRAFHELGEKGVVAIPNDTLEDFLYWLYQWAKELTDDYQRFKTLVEGILKGLAGDITAINAAVLALNQQIETLTTMMNSSVQYISSAASTALSEATQAEQVASAANAEASLAGAMAQDAESKANAALSSDASLAAGLNSVAAGESSLSTEIHTLQSDVSQNTTTIESLAKSVAGEDQTLQNEIDSNAKQIQVLKALELQPAIIPMNAVGNVQPNGWQPALPVDTWHCGAWVGIQWLMPSDHTQGGYVVFFMNRYITTSTAFNPWGGTTVSSNPNAPTGTPSAQVQTAAQIYQGDFTPIRAAFSNAGIKLPDYWTGWFSHSMMMWTDNYNGNIEIVCAINENTFSAWAFSFPGIQSEVKQAIADASSTQCANCQIQTNFYY